MIAEHLGPHAPSGVRIRLAASAGDPHDTGDTGNTDGTDGTDGT